MMRTNLLHGIAITALILGVAVWTGCGSNEVTNPALTVAYSLDNPPPIAHGPGAGVLGNAEWQTVASGWIGREGGWVRGGRYELQFSSGAVAKSTFITVREDVPNFMKIELGPDGASFKSSVYLYCSYAGTNCDPDAANYDKSVPAFLFYDPATGNWLKMAGTNLADSKKYLVKLSHFSTYALAAIPPGDGTADW